MVFITQNDFGGLGKALESVGANLGQALQKREENKFYESIFNRKRGATQQEIAQRKEQLAKDENFGNDFLSMIQNYENESQTSLAPSQIDFLWNTALSKASNQTPQLAQGNDFSQEEILALARKDPQMAKMIQDQQIADKKYRQKEESEMNKRAYEENKSFVQDMEKARNSIAQEEVNIGRINEALDSGNIRNAQNFLADWFNSEYLRTREASDLLSATKEEFINDMQQMPTGTRLNQYLERNMREALQTVGKDVGSNRKITAYQQFKTDLKKEKLKIYDKIRNSYLKNGLEPPRNLASMVNEQLKDFTNKRQKELTQEFKDINEGKISSKSRNRLEQARRRVEDRKAPPGKVWMLSPDGNIYPVPKGRVKELQGQGGEILQ